MKSIYDFVSENREETIDFLKKQPNERYTFAQRDGYEWINPNLKDDDKSCDIYDCAPFVTYSDGNGFITEYIVTAIYISHKESGDEFDVEMVDVNDYENCIDVPVSWLYGASEQYIYEMLMDLELV